METISFFIDQPMVDPPELKITEKYHLLVNIDANVKIYLGNELAFSKVLNFIELACALKEWNQSDQNGNFTFSSMDFEEEGIIQFTRTNSGYIFSSSFSQNTPKVKVTREEVSKFSNEFFKRAKQSTKENLGIDFEKYGL